MTKVSVEKPRISGMGRKPLLDKALRGWRNMSTLVLVCASIRSRHPRNRKATLAGGFSKIRVTGMNLFA